MPETTTLFRPVGSEELELIKQSGWTAFPPRLAEQPIFYPVLNEEYAIQIARDWNVPASGSGFVTQFEVNKSYIDQFEIQNVGGHIHNEYWIPAEDLDVLTRILWEGLWWCGSIIPKGKRNDDFRERV